MPTIVLDILFFSWLAWLIYDKFIFPKTFGFQRKSLKHFRKHLFSVHRMQWDVFPARTNELFLETIADCDKMLAEKDQDQSKVRNFIKEKEELIKKALPKKYTTWLAENVDSFMVTFAIAFAIRAVIFQPFKIPTGSMQPTLFGITANNTSDNILDKNYERSPEQQPKGLRSFLDGIYYGRSYYDFEIKTGEAIRGIKKLSPRDTMLKGKSVPLLSTVSETFIGDRSFLFPGTEREIVAAMNNFKDFRQELIEYDNEVHTIAVAEKDRRFQGHVQTGDFLFVNRMAYSFAEPARGDISVFDTTSLTKQGYKMAGMFYIKRLIGLPGDTLRIFKNGEMEVKEKGSESFKNLSEFIPEFTAKMYSQKGGYAGYGMEGEQGTVSEDGSYYEYSVPDGHYYLLGDNSYNSRDSRSFGGVPRGSLIGTALGVFWPFSRHWGLVDNTDPVDVKTYSNGDI